MRGLWMDLPPFSPDTSGFSAALSGTDGMGLIDDVRGCSGNYYLNEEIRPGLPVRVITSQLVNEDAVMGTKNVMTRQFRIYQEALNPSFALLCGSPIASLIGTDLHWMAQQLEAEFELPVSWVDLSGHNTYEIGLSKTLEVLARAFSQPGQPVAGRVNILGANVLDWTDEDIRAMIHWLSDAGGLEVAAVYGWNVTLEALKISGTASFNWVVSPAGLPAAKWMQAQYGIPYLTGAPFGASTCNALLRRAYTGGQGELSFPPSSSVQGKRALIIGEQFFANALRHILRGMHDFSQVRVCSFFQMDRDSMEPGDLRLKGESELCTVLENAKDALILGDPLLRQCGPENSCWLDLPHIPISAKLYAHLRPNLFGDSGDRWLAQELAKLY